VAISLTEADQSSAPALIRIARKHTGQPYPPRTNRRVLLNEADHAQAVTFG